VKGDKGGYSLDVVFLRPMSSFPQSRHQIDIGNQYSEISIDLGLGNVILINPIIFLVLGSSVAPKKYDVLMLESIYLLVRANF